MKKIKESDQREELSGAIRAESIQKREGGRPIRRGAAVLVDVILGPSTRRSRKRRANSRNGDGGNRGGGIKLGGLLDQEENWGERVEGAAAGGGVLG